MFDSLFAEPDKGAVRIALPVPIDSLFDYAVPAGLEHEARPGCRVQVPFSGRSLTGVIVEPVAADAPDAHAGTSGQELARIERVLDPQPVLSADIIRMLGEAAAEILCPIGIAIATALPPASATGVARRYVATPLGREALERGAVAEEAREILLTLQQEPLAPATLARRFPKHEAAIAQLERDRLITRAEVETAPRAKARFERTVSLARQVDLEAVCAGPLARAKKQAALLRRIAKEGVVATQALNDESRNISALLRSLHQQGFIEIGRRAAPRNVLGPPVPRDRPLSLTDEQAAALAPICSAIADSRDTYFLLHGVTGSGKTEVYLRAVAEALAQGRQALLLVPEITLTHQLVARLRARFGDTLAVLHSGLSPGERLEQWQRLATGDTPIAVGARSALFAPLENLGVIIIDEEHDSAYKNEEGFRYRAHDLARRRSAIAGCPLVLGSATPALETRYAADTGALERLVLTRRIHDRPLPSVEIVDMVREKEVAGRGKHSALTAPLRRALAETLEQKAQSVLFLNRRGFSTQIYCFECGHAERCDHCEVALVFHASEQILRCHYCDFRKPPPEKCGGCGAADNSLLGTGTERLEEEVRTLHPQARIARLDRDTAQRRGHTASVLAALHARELDILIGTQMVAKGHDFPGVRLVGVVAADMGLHMPDFRAAERTFQLLTQVAGRAGRASEPGRVVLQSFVPDHYAIEPVRRHDYEAFYAIELEFRRALSYPPFGRITQVIVSSPDEHAGRRAAHQLAGLVQPTRAEPTAPRQPTEGLQIQTEAPRYEVLGPAPAPLARLRGNHRFQLLVKGSDRARVARASQVLARAIARLPRNVRGTLDVAPVSML